MTISPEKQQKPYHYISYDLKEGMPKIDDFLSALVDKDFIERIKKIPMKEKNIITKLI